MADVVGGSIVWNLDVDKSKLSAGLSSARDDVKNSANSIDQSLDQIDKKTKKTAFSITDSFQKSADASRQFAIGLTGISASIGATLGLGLKTAAEFETLTVALETVTGSSTAAIKAMETIKKVAKDSPFFEVSTLAEFTQKMVAAGQSVDEAVKSGIGFGDVAAAFGKGNIELSRMGNTLTQVIGKGKADSVDFKELVNAGWVSVRKDTAAAMNVTMEQFEEMVTTGEVGYEQIEKAARKFTGSAEKQSSGLFATWSRLKETISTSLSTIVIDTGIFDIAKIGISNLIAEIEKFTPELTTAILNFFVWTLDNGPIIAGIIGGALAPAVGAFAASVGLAAIHLLPFIAAGVLLANVIPPIIENMGGWDNITKNVSQTFENLGFLFNTFIKPAIDDLFKVIKDSLVPEMKRLWDIISPVLIPALRFLGDIMIVIVGEALYLFIKTLEALITWVSNTVKKVNDFLEAYKQILNFFRSGDWSGLSNYITQPFKDAFNWLSDNANKIKQTIKDAFDPTQRHSPSLVDNVTSGLRDIKNAYQSLKNINLPSVSGLSPDFATDPLFSVSSMPSIDMQPGTTSNNTEQNINIEIGQISNQEDVQSLVRELGYRVAIAPQALI